MTKTYIISYWLYQDMIIDANNEIEAKKKFEKKFEKKLSSNRPVIKNYKVKGEWSQGI